MTRVALLGNSHLANWKRAWDVCGHDYPGVEFTFFAAPGSRLDCCEAGRGRLLFTDAEVRDTVTRTSGGRGEVVVDDYDAFCVVGLRFGVRAASDLYGNYRADSHRAQEGRYRLVSDACFQDAVRDRLAGSSAMRIVDKLRSITDKPIAVAAQPAVSEKSLDGDNMAKSVAMAVESGDAAALRHAYEEACRGLVATGLIIADQPSATLAAPVLTKAAYALDRDGEIDRVHANDAYGEIAIRELLDLPAFQGLAGPGRLPAPARDTVWTSIRRNLGLK